MRILAVDTSASVASCAVVEDEKLVCEQILNNKLTHSQTIMPMIASALTQSELTAADIDLFAAVTGPGSFTGLRIGVSAVKALAHAVGKPCAAVSALEAMAYNFICSDCIIAPIMDARRGQVYNALYRAQNLSLKEIAAPRAIGIEECCGELEKIGGRVIFLGDGLPVHREIIRERLGSAAVFAPANLNAQMAGSAAVLAKSKKQLHYSELAPFYLRKSQAEREYEEKQNNREEMR